MRLPARAPLLTVALLASACASAEPSDHLSQAVVYAGDDRREPYEVPDAVREALSSASGALMFAHRLQLEGRESATLRAPSSAATFRLCPDERFAEQPSAAYCSGVLVDDDLFATAGHCLGPDLAAARERCPQIRVVFGYALARADVPVTLGGDRVFSCRNVVVHATGGDHDFAAIQLDRAVTAPLSPAPVRVGKIQIGDAVTIASHTAGLPLKLELGVEVVSAAADAEFFVMASDTFTGSSGAGVFDRELGLGGLFQEGAADWDSEGGGCARSVQASIPAERSQHVDSLLTAICGAGWPSARLCGTAPGCGDHFCSASESAEQCDTDCIPASCGDGVCELAERGPCRSDCAKYDDVPTTWLGEPEFYLQSNVEPEPSPLAPAGGCTLVGSRSTSVPCVALGLMLVVISARRRRAILP